MTGTPFSGAIVDRDTAATRAQSIRYRLASIKMAFEELERDIEKCETKDWLDYKTRKRLDKAVTVMKVGYKIAKRGINRDSTCGDTNADDPPISEDDSNVLADVLLIDRDEP